MNIFNILLSRLEEVLVALALSLATILTFVEVILRYVFGSSLGFTHELVIYLLIFTGLIGASIGVREKTHIGVDIIIKNFPYKMQKVFIVGSFIISALFCGIFFILGAQHAHILIQFGQVTPEMEIPMFIPKSIIPAAFGLMTLRFIQEAVKHIKPPPKKVLRKEGEH